MGIAAAELDINTKHLNELAFQIRNVSDCEVLYLIIKENLGSVKDLFNDMQRESSKLLSDILPILNLPSPDPVSIVTWIGKFVTGLVTPQLKAQVKYVKKMVLLGVAIINIIEAIKEAKNRLPNCFVVIQNHVLDEIQNEVDTLIGGALSTINQTQINILAIVDVANTIAKIDTTSPTAFIQTVDASIQAIDSRVATYRQT